MFAVISAREGDRDYATVDADAWEYDSDSHMVKFYKVTEFRGFETFKQLKTCVDAFDRRSLLRITWVEE